VILISESDISDLFGADIPTNKPGVFRWVDVLLLFYFFFLKKILKGSISYCS
jgi:midasin (ATPase involved in ribosome maturation)